MVQSDAFIPPVGCPDRPDVEERPGGVRPEVEIDGVTSRVLVEQVDVGRPGELVAHLTPQESWASTRRC